LIAVQFATFWCVLILLVVATVRLRRTSSGHPDRAARRDYARLLAVVAAGLGLSVVRTQFLPESRMFLGLSIALVPLGFMALWLIARLIGVYRHQKPASADPTLPDVQTVRSRINPPFDGPKR
jgi:hypothetical protein